MLGKVDTTHYTDDHCNIASAGFKQPDSLVVEQSMLKIYPNPAQDYFTVEYSLKHGSYGKVEMMDLFGRVVAHLKLEPGEGVSHTSVTDMMPAVYIYQFYENENVISSGKIVIYK